MTSYLNHRNLRNFVALRLCCEDLRKLRMRNWANWGVLQLGRGRLRATNRGRKGRGHVSRHGGVSRLPRCPRTSAGLRKPYAYGLAIRLGGMREETVSNWAGLHWGILLGERLSSMSSDRRFLQPPIISPFAECVPGWTRVPSCSGELQL